MASGMVWESLSFPMEECMVSRNGVFLVAREQGRHEVLLSFLLRLFIAVHAHYVLTLSFFLSLSYYYHHHYYYYTSLPPKNKITNPPDGQYDNGNRHGKGIFTWPYGASFEGVFQNEKRNGHGEYYFPDGRRYVGQYANDRPQGHGSEYDKDGNLMFEGHWEAGEFRGGDTASLQGSLALSK